ncbi:amidohydrolase family protein [Streptomyces shenzhenensis]
MDSSRGISRRVFVTGSAAGLAAMLPSARAHPTASADTLSATRTVTFTEATNGSVSISPAGHRLIVEVQGVLWSLAADGGTATALTTPDLEAVRAAWSPDGTRIAVCGYQDGGFHLWVMAPDGSGLRQVTSGPWDDRGVAWSPDGSRIAFSSERGGAPVAGAAYGIWTVHPDTGELTQLTGEAGAEDHDPVWHPSGERVLFVRAGAAGGRALASVPAAGGTAEVERTVPSGTIVGPAVASDGRVAWVHVADYQQPATYADTCTLMVDDTVVSGGEDVSPQPPCWSRDGELFYMSDGRIRARAMEPGVSTGRGRAVLAPSRSIPFTASLDVPAAHHPRKRHDFDSADGRRVLGIHQPALSPDGTRIVFVALNTLWIQPIGGRARALVRASPSAYVQMPSWAPDGDTVLYACEGEDRLIGVRRVGADGAGDRELAGGGRLNPVLSPDGTTLACHDSTGNLLLRDLGTGQERVLTAPLGGNGLPGRPSWSPDGRRLVFCDRNRLNRRFREGYNVIRVVDTVTGEWTAHLPLPHASLSDRGSSGPVWSPDGTMMAFVMESALWIMPVASDGTPAGAPVRLTEDAADHPSWSGDSRTLLYLSNGRLRTTAVTPGGGEGTSEIEVGLMYRRSLPPPVERVRIHAGRLWDGTGDTVLENVDIVIAGHRIASVEAHRHGAGRPDERFVDASASTVVPGLWDCHTHPWQYTYGGRQNLLMLAYGATSNVSLGGFAYESVAIKESVMAGTLYGPRQFTTGELIDGSRVAYSMGRAHRTEDGVRRSLDRAVALDYDVVKTYVRAPARTMREAARTAHERLGVPSGSHFLSPGISVGHDLTTHLHASQRTEYGRALSPTCRSYGDVHMAYAGGDFRIVATPFSALSLIGTDPGLARDPRVSTLMPPWDAALVTALAAAPPPDTHTRALHKETAVYRRIVDGGGMLALGTDAPLNPVGLALHLGLRALHQVGGLTPAAALRSVTVTPARMFGVDADLGTVEPGKIADLAVVDGNPFEDFDDLIRVTSVVRDGVVHRVADLVRSAAPGLARRQPPDIDWLRVYRDLHRETCCGGSGPEV